MPWPRILLESLAVLVGVAGVWVAWKAPDRVGWKSLLAVYALRVLALWFWIVCLGRSIHYDMECWCLHAGWMVERGLRAGLDFRTPYGPGFNAGLAALHRLCPSQFPVAAALSLAELGALACFHRFARRLAGGLAAKRAVIVYATCPACLVLSFAWTQDESLTMLGLAGALCAPALAMPLVGVATLFCAKLMAGMFLVPLVFARGWRLGVASCAAFLAYAGGLKVLGYRPLDFVFGLEPGMEAAGIEIVKTKLGGNVWALFGKRLPEGFEMAATLVVLSLVGCWFVLHLVARTGRELPGGEAARVRTELCIRWMVAWTLAFCVFNAATLGPYILPAVPFMFLLALMERDGVRRRSAVALVFVWTSWKTYLPYSLWLVRDLAPSLHPVAVAASALLGVGLAAGVSFLLAPQLYRMPKLGEET